LGHVTTIEEKHVQNFGWKTKEGMKYVKYLEVDERTVVLYFQGNRFGGVGSILLPKLRTTDQSFGNANLYVVLARCSSYLRV
jgi:hypothetical protein